MRFTTQWRADFRIKSFKAAVIRFSAHPGCSIGREHVASPQRSDWLLSKSTCPGQMVGGETFRPVKRTMDQINQRHANQVPYIARVIQQQQNHVELLSLQAHSGFLLCLSERQDSLSECPWCPGLTGHEITYCVKGLCSKLEKKKRSCRGFF